MSSHPISSSGTFQTLKYAAVAASLCRGVFCMRHSTATQRRGYSPCFAWAQPRTSEFMGIGKPLQKWFVARWAQILDDVAKYRIQQGVRVSHIKVEGHQLAIQMQLLLIV